MYACINIGCDLLLGSITDVPVYASNASKRFQFLKERESVQLEDSDFLVEFCEKEQEFLNSLKIYSMKSMVAPIKALVQSNVTLAYTMWTTMFSLSWNCFNNIERHDYTKFLIILLAKEYNTAQMTLRPNVVQCLLEGVKKSNPRIQLPPQLVKYLGKNYNAWFIAIELLENCVEEVNDQTSKDEDKIRDSFLDALADMYSDLSENDYFAGLWRRRCLFPETNAAVSYEQCGAWAESQKFYENAQVKAKTCTLQFHESEYILWEKQWAHCQSPPNQFKSFNDFSFIEFIMMIKSTWL
jgi:transformation/transcription domain-associated protein